ncbi:hypothetical protein F0170_11930 [Pseudomonas sp. MAFF 730085]|uniref:Uncharacterized protein n=1 Tax=Pseudomonas kitaguniensis TaxID=2607908 RepID=A0A5N7JTA9_9PSED|nr:hypothetical protein [Pseudomonas kitaguniensis]
MPSASANRWLSVSCTSKAGASGFKVDTLGKALSQGNHRKWTFSAIMLGQDTKRKPGKQTRFTSTAQLRTHGPRPDSGSTIPQGTH